MNKRYCGMCDRMVKGKECPFCGADTDMVRQLLRRTEHTCHDMQPPFAGPCAACEHEREEALATPVYPTAIHAENPQPPKPVDLMDALRRALPKEQK